MAEASSIDSEATAARRAPWWAVVPLSLLIACHFGAIVVNTLVVRSGPWPMFGGDGVGFGSPPTFIPETLAEKSSGYLTALHLNENFQLPSCRISEADVAFEAILYGEDGKESRRIQFPDPNAWWFTRSREAMLAKPLNSDEPREAGAGEGIAPEGDKGRSQWVWRVPPGDPKEAPVGKIELVPQHLISRTEREMGPSAWALAASESYANYFRRVYNASAVEIRRKFRLRVVPFAVNPAGPQPTEEVFQERAASFGKVTNAAAPAR